MEGDKFSWFAKNYLRKRPRYSPTSFPDDQMASTSTCMPSTSSASSASASTSNRRTNSQRILIEPSDEQLLKWQEKQISKCIVDNTLNRVVESYITFWEEENNTYSGSTRNELEREAQLVSLHTNRAQQNFEDSAIMWAIDQHGLQQHNHNLFNDHRTETMSSTSSISLSSPPHPPSQDDFCEFNAINELNHNTNSEDQAEVVTKCNETKPEQESQHKSMQLINDVEGNTSQAATEPTNDEHFDFLEAAVSVAIQEKGLGSYTMQKSPNR